MPSLKHFHIMFVSISAIFCLFFAYWGYIQHSMIYVTLSIVSTIILMFYGKVFYNKVKDF